MRPVFSPIDVVLVDVNEDGILDAAVAFSIGNVAISLGNGNGTFQAPNTFATGTGGSARGIAGADINGDGHIDLVTTNHADNTVSVLLGFGNGSFQPQQTYRTGANPYQLTLGDVTGDGKIDALVGTLGGSCLTILQGNGDGTFQAAKTLAAGPQTVTVEMADVNGDLIPDLVTSNLQGASVSVLLGLGNGSFQAHKTYAAGTSPRLGVPADFNHDGKIDLMVTNSSNDTIGILLGNGNGTFQNVQTYAAGDIPRWMDAGDVDGDGNLDIIVGSATSLFSFGLYKGNGDGTFQNQITFTGGTSYISPFAGTFADVNNDGQLDIVQADNGYHLIGVLLGNTNSSFTGQSYGIDRAPPTAALRINPQPALRSATRPSPSRATIRFLAASLRASTMWNTSSMAAISRSPRAH